MYPNQADPPLEVSIINKFVRILQEVICASICKNIYIYVSYI